MAVYTETIKLKDEVSDAAKKAAHETNLLERAIKSTQDQLTKASALGDVNRYRKLTKDLDAYKASLSVLPPLERRQAGAVQESTVAIGEELKVLGGMASALAVAAAAGVAFVAVVGAGIIAGAKFAIEARSDKLAVEGFYEAMSQGLNTGAEVNDMVEALGARIGIAKDTLEPFTKDLMAMGITALPELEASLLAVTSAEALMGKTGSAAFLSLTQKIQSAVQAGVGLKIPIKGLGSLAEVGLQVSDVSDLMGISAKELASQLKNGTVNAMKFGEAMQDAVINKGASALDRMSASMKNLKANFMTNLADMFEDIDVAPFLAEVRELFNIFSQAKPSGQALKAGIGGFFKEVFGTAKDLVPMVKHFMLDLIIYGLKAYIALKPIAKWFTELGNNAGAMKIINAAFRELQVAAIGVGAALAIVAAVGTAIGAGIAFAVTSLLALKQGFADIGNAVYTAVTGWIAQMPGLGTAIVQGLVSGIVGGVSAVGGAVASLAMAAKDTFKNVLGIASPSKVMFQMGENVAQGASLGIESGAPQVHGASTTLAAAAAQGMGETSNNSSRSIQVFAEFNFAGAGGGGGPSQTELTEQAVALIFERVALEAGL